MKKIFIFFICLLSFSVYAEQKLTNVSFQLSKNLYDEYNELFLEYWNSKYQKPISLSHSHKPPSQSIPSIIDGYKVDVLTLTNSGQIDRFAKAGIIDKNWRKRMEHDSSPYSSTVVFVVRAGNPKKIKDWNDLIKPGTSVVFPHPETSDNGRHVYLAALAYARKNYRSEEMQEQFMRDFIAHVAVFDVGGTAVTNRFVKGISDALITFESEAYSVLEKYNDKNFEIIVPSISVQVNFPAVWLDKYVDIKGTRELAEEYVKYLYSQDAQKLLAKFNYRVRDISVMLENAEKFPELIMISPEEIEGSWQEINKKHFAQGVGTFYKYQK